MINQMGPSDYHGEIPETRSERSESGESVAEEHEFLGISWMDYIHTLRS